MIASERAAATPAVSDADLEWLRRLDRDVEQAATGEIGYREAIARRRRWMQSRRSSADRSLRASETWALADVEWAAGHHGRGLELIEAGLPGLRDVSNAVLRRAIALVGAAAARELAADRASVAGTMCDRALLACAGRDVLARLRCLCDLAAVHARTGAHASLVATCEEGFALARNLLAIDVHGDPYRDGRPRYQAGAPEVRDAIVSLSVHAALTRAAQGSFDDADHVLDRARALLGATLSAAERARLGLVGARVARVQGRLPAALRLYAETVDLIEGAASTIDLDALCGMAWTYFELDALDRAAELANRIRRADPGNGGAADLLARIELARGDHRAAEHWARRAITERSSGPVHASGGLRTIAEIHLARGELGEARAATHRAIATLAEELGGHAPETVEAYLTLARVETAFGAEPQAEACFRRALDTRMPHDHPRLLAPLVAFAEFLELEGRLAEAAPLRERVRAIRDRLMRS